MRHLLLWAVSVFHHPNQPIKPTLNKARLDQTLSQLVLDDHTKLICVYPVLKTSDGPVADKAQRQNTDARQ
jgi:hypothetical protein